MSAKTQEEREIFRPSRVEGNSEECRANAVNAIKLVSSPREVFIASLNSRLCVLYCLQRAFDLSELLRLCFHF